MRFVIYGFTGSGKTSYLNQLSDELEASKFKFVDLDQYILGKHSESSISEIIEKNSWKYFRSMEEKYLSSLLEYENIYIALGGGSVTKELIQILRRFEFEGIYLDVDFEVCWSRIKDDPWRPISKLGKKACYNLYLERAALFEELKNESN